MEIEGQYHERLNAITHSPYYGCTVGVLSKAHVSYEGVLDGISANKDRIYLKNVRVNANLAASPNRNKSVDDLNTSDTLNAVMIDHLTNDIRTYEQVCLNVRDIQELRLIQLPSTFHESKAKLRAIDPCLVDIRLSPSDEYVTRSPISPTRTAIARRTRVESFDSNGSSPLISSSSNESSSSFGLRSNDKFTNESNDESLDEHIETKFRQLKTTTTTNNHSKPPTLLAKKVLPKKFERNTNLSSPSTNPNILKKPIGTNQNRKVSPIRVTITSNLNPNATPFYIQQQQQQQQRPVPLIQNPTFNFYDQSRATSRIQPVNIPDRSQSLPYGINTINIQQQQQKQNYQQQHHSHQRFIPPRHMANKRNFPQNNSRGSNQTPPPPIMRYRLQPTTSFDKRPYPQQQQQHKQKISNNIQIPGGFIRQTSLTGSNQSLSIPPRHERFNAPRNYPRRLSTASLRSTTSLPYQYGSAIDCNQLQTPSSSFGEPIGSNRHQRTVSGASSCSSISLDIGPHSIRQFDSLSSNVLTSFEEQYDFEKANEEFRRYLELEELVSRRTPTPSLTVPSSADDPSTQIPTQQTNSYKKDLSFFDRISCTATTGTAVAYTEVDEIEKNLETFGNDALLLSSKSSEDEWRL